ncbi:hypothetical protein C8T65DRAFT_667907, partial [Cerioporus squamosus]
YVPCPWVKRPSLLCARPCVSRETVTFHWSFIALKPVLLTISLPSRSTRSLYHPRRLASQELPLSPLLLSCLLPQSTASSSTARRPPLPRSHCLPNHRTYWYMDHSRLRPVPLATSSDLCCRPQLARRRFLPLVCSVFSADYASASATSRSHTPTLPAVPPGSIPFWPPPTVRGPLASALCCWRRLQPAFLDHALLGLDLRARTACRLPSPWARKRASFVL